MSTTLRISEIFRSIQGETTRAGRPCAFVRVAGCNLSCAWCDTPYARDGSGSAMDLDDVCARVAEFGMRLVCITGGEPLLQADAVATCAERLLRAGHTVLVETNGTRDLSLLPQGAVRVMDVKCPGSGECGATLPGNLSLLRERDEVKFVLTGRRDFDWAAAFVQRHGLGDGPAVLFAPVRGRLAATRLAGWILESGLDVRLQLQLHKLLWPGRDRGV